MAESTTCDVLVIGGGIAGLTCAYQICKRDPKLTVHVVEAKPRVGGRTLTITLRTASGMDRWDLGGQWVGITQHHILELLRDLDLKTYPQYVTGRKMAQLGTPEIYSYKTSLPSFSLVETLDFVQMFARLERVSKTINARNLFASPYAAYLNSVSVQELARKWGWSRAVLDSVDCGCLASFGMDSSRISALYFALYGHSAGSPLDLFESTGNGAQSLRVKGGAQQISELLSERIGANCVHLNSPVSKVVQSQHSDYVEVFVVGRSDVAFRAKRIVIAVPPSQAARIEYEPALPEMRRQLLNNCQMGNLVKFVATYSRTFWRDRQLSGEIAATGQTYDSEKVQPLVATFDATTNNGSPAIVGFVNIIPYADMTFEQRRTAVLQDLARFLGPDALHCVDYQDKNWSEEPWSGGCPVGIMPPGHMEWFTTIREPCGRIHWSGTETAVRWMGYMSGAVESGLRAASEVLFHLSSGVVGDADLADTVYAKHYVKPQPPCRQYQKHWLRNVLLTSAGCVLLMFSVTLIKRFTFDAPVRVRFIRYPSV